MNKFNCYCGKKADTLFTMFDLVASHLNRPLCLDCKLLCKEHAEELSKEHGKYFYFIYPVSLTAQTRDMLVKQIIAQTIKRLPGYLPKTDIRRALTIASRRKAVS